MAHLTPICRSAALTKAKASALKARYMDCSRFILLDMGLESTRLDKNFHNFSLYAMLYIADCIVSFICTLHGMFIPPERMFSLQEK